MILVDTSIWIRHLRESEPRLVELLDGGDVWTHEFVLGELACGSFQRRETLVHLQGLPCLRPALHAEVMLLLESFALFGSGIGWIDAHLVAAARIGGSKIWTADRRMALVATKLQMNWGE